MILEWNDVLSRQCERPSPSAPEQGGPILRRRAFAIVSAAMYDAYNSVEHIGESFLVSVPLAARPMATRPSEAAARHALALISSQKLSFDSALWKTLLRIPNGFSEIHGRVVGALVARRILADRADDGAGDLANNTYIYNGLPGFHKADPINPNQGYYGRRDQCRSVRRRQSRPVPGASSRRRHARRAIDVLQSEEYTHAYNEVLALGGDGSVDSPTDARRNRPRSASTGLRRTSRLGHSAAAIQPDCPHRGGQRAQHRGGECQTVALVNVAMADAGLTSWNNKYDDAFWRPVMGIRKGDLDENPDTEGFANWTPLGAPASNPGRAKSTSLRPSPHILRARHVRRRDISNPDSLLWTDDISFTFVSDELNGVTLDADGTARPLASRTFESFTEAKLENAQSRIYPASIGPSTATTASRPATKWPTTCRELFRDSSVCARRKIFTVLEGRVSKSETNATTIRLLNRSLLSVLVTPSAGQTASVGRTQSQTVDALMSQIGEDDAADERLLKGAAQGASRGPGD